MPTPKWRVFLKKLWDVRDWLGTVGSVRPDKRSFGSSSGSPRLMMQRLIGAPRSISPAMSWKHLGLQGSYLTLPAGAQWQGWAEKTEQGKEGMGGDGDRDHAWGIEGEKEIDGRLVVLLCTQNTFVRRLISCSGSNGFLCLIQIIGVFTGLRCAGVLLYSRSPDYRLCWQRLKGQTRNKNLFVLFALTAVFCFDTSGTTRRPLRNLFKA